MTPFKIHYLQSNPWIRLLLRFGTPELFSKCDFIWNLLPSSSVNFFKIWTYREEIPVPFDQSPQPRIDFWPLGCAAGRIFFHTISLRGLLKPLHAASPYMLPSPLPPPPSITLLLTTECTLNQGCFSLGHRQNVHWVWFFFFFGGGKAILSSCVSPWKTHSKV